MGLFNQWYAECHSSFVRDPGFKIDTCALADWLGSICNASCFSERSQFCAGCGILAGRLDHIAVRCDELIAKDTGVRRLGCFSGKYQLVAVVISSRDRHRDSFAAEIRDVGCCDGKRRSLICQREGWWNRYCVGRGILLHIREFRRCFCGLFSRLIRSKCSTWDCSADKKCECSESH